MTVACVLRSGGLYTPAWVHALAAGVEEHLPGAEFVCLTDMRVHGVECVPLTVPWAGWWSKLNLFAPGVFSGSVLYLDLDTLPVGDLSELASYAGPLAMISVFKDPRGAESGVMAFTPGEETERLWELWTADPVGHMATYRGDGPWLDAHTKPDRLQTLYPGQIVSYKHHARKCPPPGARLVCGHGRPRFSDSTCGWAHELWQDRARCRAAA